MEIIINSLFEKKDELSNQEIETIEEVIKSLDNGSVQIVQKINNVWQVNEWVKKAILLYFRIKPNKIINNAPGDVSWFDKIDNKFNGWQEENFKSAQIRAVPLSFVRYGAYIAPKVVLMPCFVNIGAYVGSATMIDSWATVGSCAQIGKNCHISADVCIGGVLEPLQATPVIIEDNCFIGAGSKILEGVIVEENSVVAAGSVISASSKIVNRETGEIHYGKIPKGSVVVPGSIASKNNVALNCAVIIKTVDAKTKSKTNINELLRD